MLLVQEFLKTKSLNDLTAEHAVKARISEERPWKASFNYDQIEARDSDLLAQQCRGLVLRTADGSPMTVDQPLGETVILAMPFSRFFNAEQGAAAPVNLESDATAIFEKLDGTLAIIYHDDIHGEWHTATRSVCEANLALNGWETFTFRTLFEKALFDTLWRKSEAEVRKMMVTAIEAGVISARTPAEVFTAWVEQLDKSRTYMFELCTPLNQVVVVHQDYQVTLIGCRETATGREFWPDTIAPALGVPHVERYRFGNVEEMLEFVRDRDPKMYEGIVACEEHEPGVFRRLKIKNAQYLAYSRLKDAVSSPRNVMMLILGENLDDAFVVMPEAIKEQALKMQEGIRRLFHNYIGEYAALYQKVCAMCPTEVHGSKEHRKQFAIAAKASGIWFEPAMMQYGGKCTDARDFVAQKREDNGEYPHSFLDYLINRAEKAMEEKAKIDQSFKDWIDRNS